MAPSNKKVAVDREEYDALCTLRDTEHERILVELAAVKENYKGCLAVNRAQVTRLHSQDLEITDLRSRIRRLESVVAGVTGTTTPKEA